MIRNYFADLELDTAASVDDVRKAYKRLARKFHPDLNPLDAQAEEAFRKISEAFDHLNSNTRILRLRKQMGEMPRDLVRTNFGRWGNYPLVPDSAEQFINHWGDEPSIQRAIERPNEQLNFWISVDVTSEELRTGTSRQFKIKFDKPCDHCRGSGARARSVSATCKRCAGLGHFLIERGAMHWKKTCDECLGKGHVVAAPCSNCEGKGKLSEEELIELQISKKANPAEAFVLKGHGHISYDGTKRGDIWVQLVQRR